MRVEPTFRSAGAKEGFGLAVTCRLRADEYRGEALQKLSEEDGHGQGKFLYTIGAISFLPLLSLSIPV